MKLSLKNKLRLLFENKLRLLFALIQAWWRYVSKGKSTAAFIGVGVLDVANHTTFTRDGVEFDGLKIKSNYYIHY